MAASVTAQICSDLFQGEETAKRNLSHPFGMHGTLIAVVLYRKICSRALSGALLSAVVTAGGASAQQEAAPASLPSAPSAVLTHGSKGLLRPAGSGVTFVPVATQPGPGGAKIELPQDAPLPLSLDDAISLSLQRNIRMQYDRANLREVKGYKLQVANALVPSITANASSSAQEINLAAMGFNPTALAGFGLPPGTIPTIVKVNVTQALLNADQTLFDLPAFELYKGAKKEFTAVDLNVLNSRGEVVLAVGQAYLKVLADQTSVANAQAEERAAQTLFSQATDKLTVGVGTNLDNLRAQVEYQQRQQTTVSAAAQLDKDIIQLNRIMGIPAGQKLELTDTVPFSELASMDLDEAKATAYQHRKDLLSMQAEIEVSEREFRAAKYQRLPTLAFSGYYGVIGETTGLYHGVFRAAGTLKFPIFREAGQRGDEQQISAQLMALRQREASLRIDIEAQIRASMLDVKSSAELVKVGQSNVALAQQELSDTRDRFNAGVDTNLAVVNSQASVTGANAQLVQAMYQYNTAKLTLARQTGIIESSYRDYLGK